MTLDPYAEANRRKAITDAHKARVDAAKQQIADTQQRIADTKKRAERQTILDKPYKPQL